MKQISLANFAVSATSTFWTSAWSAKGVIVRHTTSATTSNDTLKKHGIVLLVKIFCDTA